LKYLLFGAVSTGSMLYGITLFFGLTGATKMTAMRGVLEHGAGSGGNLMAMLVATALVLAGFGFKIAAVPFHFWCPDVYEGAPTAVTAFLSVGPKAAGFAVLIRFLDGLAVVPGLGGAALPWRAALAILCTATMTLGNLAALPQQNLKRLLAYSSIAHAGYLLTGVTLAGSAGAQAVLFYLAVYLFMNLGAFACVLALEERLGVTDVGGCRGLGRSHPGLAAAFTVFLLSLTGIPPVAGFAGKLMLFQALVAAKTWPWIALAVLGVLNSVVSLFYYARIIKAMYLEDVPEAVPAAVPVPAYYHALVWLCVVPTLILGVWFGPLVEWTRRAAACLGH
jgi:NADH-quinone oxidoreductase subunit N